jgi:hypothetical protein
MTRLKWDEETIGHTLGGVIAELGRMPTRTELEARGLSSLWSAMRRNGGTRFWAAQATALAAAAPPVVMAPPIVVEEAVEDRIRVRAYFLAMEGAPGGPEAHWLRAERELVAS